MPATAHTPRTPTRGPAPSGGSPAAGRLRLRPVRGLALLAVSGLLAATAGCGGRSRSTEGSPQSQRTALLGYLREIEPLRLAVNRLLNGADPILADYARGRLSTLAASRRMGALEARFAAYTVDIAAIEPATPGLRGLHALYAH